MARTVFVSIVLSTACVAFAAGGVTILLSCPTGTSVQGRSLYSPFTKSTKADKFLFCILCGVPGEEPKTHSEICYNQKFFPPHSREDVFAKIKYEYQDCNEEFKENEKQLTWLSQINMTEADPCTRPFCSAQFPTNETMEEVLNKVKMYSCNEEHKHRDEKESTIICPRNYFLNGFTARRIYTESYVHRISFCIQCLTLDDIEPKTLFVCKRNETAKQIRSEIRNYISYLERTKICPENRFLQSLPPANQLFNSSAIDCDEPRFCGITFDMTTSDSELDVLDCPTPHIVPSIPDSPEHSTQTVGLISGAAALLLVIVIAGVLVFRAQRSTQATESARGIVTFEHSITNDYYGENKGDNTEIYEHNSYYQ